MPTTDKRHISFIKTNANAIANANANANAKPNNLTTMNLTRRDLPFKARRSPLDYRTMFHAPMRDRHEMNATSYDMPTLSMLKK